MRTSIYNFETRESIDGKPYIMEVSPRGGGNRLAEMIRFATGVDLIMNAVKAAVGEPVVGLQQKDYNGYWAEYILHSFEEGKYQDVFIDSELKKKNVVELDIWVKKGEQVHTFAAANYAIGTVVLRFDSKKEMELIMQQLDSKIKIVVE